MRLFKDQLVTDEEIEKRTGANRHEVGKHVIQVKADGEQFHQDEVAGYRDQSI
jgi:biotin operon repressor